MNINYARRWVALVAVPFPKRPCHPHTHPDRRDQNASRSAHIGSNGGCGALGMGEPRSLPAASEVEAPAPSCAQGLAQSPEAPVPMGHYLWMGMLQVCARI